MDLPDSDRGDFSCRRAVDSSSSYSGLGADADLLIHEATMEDGMEEDAWNKRHW